MASAEGASTRSALDKSTKRANCLLQYQHDVRQHKKEKTRYKKYQAGLPALRNLIASKTEELFVWAHNSIITGFRLVDPIVLMKYTQTNYGTVILEKLQENEIALDEQWYPSTTIAVLFTRIEDCKLSTEAGE